jgi:hypothetical protein
MRIEHESVRHGVSTEVAWLITDSDANNPSKIHLCG